MTAFPATPETAPVRPLLRLAHWIALFWLASAAILLDMRSEMLASFDFGDTDDAMRLVQTRDLLDGQSWFDHTQYRLDPPEGVDMHWSRLPDAALAGLILISRPLFGEAGAERFAVAAWPLLLLLAWYVLLAGLGRRIAGPEGGLVALFLGLLAVAATAQFLPARIDHHGLQIVLALALVAALIRAPERPAAGALAGVIAALMLAIGLETLPHILAGEVALAILWARDPVRLAPAVRLHGLAFAGATAAFLVATTAPAAWREVHCDSLSVFYVAAAALAGVIWTGAARPRRAGGIGTRFGLLALAGAGAAALLLLVFPECRGGPYALIDDRLVDLWLSHVREAQPFMDLAGERPDMLISFLGFPLLGLVGLVFALTQEGRRTDWTVIGACFTAALLTSLWQVRGSFFASSFAVLPVTFLVTRLLARARKAPAPWQRIAASVAILATLNGLPFAMAGQKLAGRDEQKAEERQVACRSGEALAPLAALPPALVLSDIDLGPSILVHSAHGVLSAPYHRNLRGLHDAFDIWMAPPDDARRLLGYRGVGIIAFCAGQAGMIILANRAPDGLAARLRDGSPPDWLSPLATTGMNGLKLFRVADTSREPLTDDKTSASKR